MVYPRNTLFGLTSFNRTRKVQPEGVFSAYLKSCHSDELGLILGGRFRPTAIFAKVERPRQGIDAESANIPPDAPDIRGHEATIAQLANEERLID